ncbi:MAG: hypothetical protein IKT25_06880, partial [Firmicutes bacterium]|nr:hypothetical protein [Bacillota bacterium]
DISGTSTMGYIKYVNGAMYDVRANMSLKGYVYSVTSKGTKAQTSKKYKLIDMITNSIYVEEETKWEVTSNLIGDKYVFSYDSIMRGEAKISASVMEHVRYYLFVHNLDNMEMLLLLMLAIDVIATYRMKEISKNPSIGNEKRRKPEIDRDGQKKRSNRKSSYDDICYYELDDNDDE